MAIQLKDTVRNSRIDAIEAAGATPAIQIRTGAQPANCATANAGTLLWDVSLTATWLNAASGGTATKAGTWTGTAVAAGTAEHFRIFNSTVTKDNTTCIMQGSVGLGSGDLSLDNNSVASGQTITVNTFSITDGNA